jgi:hypothetical protein
MGCRIALTSLARKNLLALPSAAVGRAVQGALRRIAADPIKGVLTIGVWLDDGMLPPAAGSYYYRITYKHIVGSDLVTVTGIQVVPATGPH